MATGDARNGSDAERFQDQLESAEMILAKSSEALLKKTKILTGTKEERKLAVDQYVNGQMTAEVLLDKIFTDKGKKDTDVTTRMQEIALAREQKAQAIKNGADPSLKREPKAVAAVTPDMAPSAGATTSPDAAKTALDAATGTSTGKAPDKKDDAREVEFREKNSQFGRQINAYAKVDTKFGDAPNRRPAVEFWLRAKRSGIDPNAYPFFDRRVGDKKEFGKFADSVDELDKQRIASSSNLRANFGKNAEAELEGAIVRELEREIAFNISEFAKVDETFSKLSADDLQNKLKPLVEILVKEKRDATDDEVAGLAGDAAKLKVLLKNLVIIESEKALIPVEFEQVKETRRAGKEKEKQDRISAEKAALEAAQKAADAAATATTIVPGKRTSKKDEAGLSVKQVSPVDAAAAATEAERVRVLQEGNFQHFSDLLNPAKRITGIDNYKELDVLSDAISEKKNAGELSAEQSAELYQMILTEHASGNRYRFNQIKDELSTGQSGRIVYGRSALELLKAKIDSSSFDWPMDDAQKDELRGMIAAAIAKLDAAGATPGAVVDAATARELQMGLLREKNYKALLGRTDEIVNAKKAESFKTEVEIFHGSGDLSDTQRDTLLGEVQKKTEAGHDALVKLWENRIAFNATEKRKKYLDSIKLAIEANKEDWELSPVDILFLTDLIKDHVAKLDAGTTTPDLKFVEPAFTAPAMPKTKAEAEIRLDLLTQMTDGVLLSYPSTDKKFAALGGLPEKGRVVEGWMNGDYDAAKMADFTDDLAGFNNYVSNRMYPLLEEQRLINDAFPTGADAAAPAPTVDAAPAVSPELQTAIDQYVELKQRRTEVERIIANPPPFENLDVRERQLEDILRRQDDMLNDVSGLRAHILGAPDGLGLEEVGTVGRLLGELNARASGLNFLPPEPAPRPIRLPPPDLSLPPLPPPRIDTGTVSSNEALVNDYLNQMAEAKTCRELREAYNKVTADATLTFDDQDRIAVKFDVLREQLSQAAVTEVTALIDAAGDRTALALAREKLRFHGDIDQDNLNRLEYFNLSDLIDQKWRDVPLTAVEKAQDLVAELQEESRQKGYDLYALFDQSVDPAKQKELVSALIFGDTTAEKLIADGVIDLGFPAQEIKDRVTAYHDAKDKVSEAYDAVTAAEEAEEAAKEAAEVKPGFFASVKNFFTRTPKAETVPATPAAPKAPVAPGKSWMDQIGDSEFVRTQFKGHLTERERKGEEMTTGEKVKTVSAALLGAAGSLVGVKLLPDLARYAGQYIYTKQEMEKLTTALVASEKLKVANGVAASGEVLYSPESIAASFDMKKQAIEAMPNLTDAAKAPLLAKIEQIRVETMAKAKATEADYIKNAGDAVLAEIEKQANPRRIKGSTLVKDAASTAAFWGGLHAVRAGAYVGVSAFERGRTVTREMRSGERKGNFVKEFAVGAFTETYAKLTTGTKREKFMEATKAVATVARLAGLTAAAYESVELNHVIDRILEAVHFKTEVTSAAAQQAESMTETAEAGASTESVHEVTAEASASPESVHNATVDTVSTPASVVELPPEAAVEAAPAIPEGPMSFADGSHAAIGDVTKLHEVASVHAWDAKAADNLDHSTASGILAKQIDSLGHDKITALGYKGGFEPKDAAALHKWELQEAFKIGPKDWLSHDSVNQHLVLTEKADGSLSYAWAGDLSKHAEIADTSHLTMSLHDTAHEAHGATGDHSTSVEHPAGASADVTHPSGTVETTGSATGNAAETVSTGTSYEQATYSGDWLNHPHQQIEYPSSYGEAEKAALLNEAGIEDRQISAFKQIFAEFDRMAKESHGSLTKDDVNFEKLLNALIKNHDKALDKLLTHPPAHAQLNEWVKTLTVSEVFNKDGAEILKRAFDNSVKIPFASQKAFNDFMARFIKG